MVAKPRIVVTVGLDFTFRITKVSTVTRIGGVVVAKPRTVVTFGLVSGRRVSKVSTVTGIGGWSWSRNADLSSLLDSFLRFALQKCQQSQGSGGVVVAKPRIVVTFGLASGFCVSKVSTVTGIGGVVVAKPRIVVTVGLVFTFRIKEVSTVTGIGGGRGRETQNCRHFWTRLVSSRFTSVNSHRDPGGSWSRNPDLSSLLDSPRVFAFQKCQQSQGSGGVVVAKRRPVVTVGLVFTFRITKVSTVTGINPELSSLLDSSRLFAFHKCQQSQGSGGVVVAKPRIVVTVGLDFTFRITKVSTITGIGGVVVAKRRIVVTFGLVSGVRVSQVSTVTGIRGGRGRETQICRHFWTRLGSSRLESVNSHRDPGGVVVAKPRIVVTFGLASGLRVSKVSTVTGIQGGRGRETQNCRHFWTRLGSSRLKSVNSHRDRGGRGREAQNCRHFWTCLVSSRLKSVNSHRDPGGLGSRSPELSSLLDSPRVFASQKCQQSQGSGGVVVAKPRIVVTFGLASGLRVSKVSTVKGIGGSWSRRPELSSLLASPLERGKERGKRRGKRRKER